MENKRENTAAVSKFSIVNTIITFFKLGDSGKLDSFFTRLVRDFERAVNQIEINMNILKSQYDQQITEIEEALEDANQSVEDAWKNVTPEQVATNALQESFKNDFIANIERAEAAVDRHQERLEKAKERYKEERQEMADQIKAYKARIAKITGSTK